MGLHDRSSLLKRRAASQTQRMQAAVTARWFSDGSGAWIDDDADDRLLRIGMERWHEPGDRVGAPSWTVSFTVMEEHGPMAHLRRLEPDPAGPAVDDRRRIELTRLALEAAD